MKELLLTLGVADVTEAVTHRLTEADFQAKANLELAEFLENSRNIRRALTGGDLSDLLTPQPPRPN